MLAQDDAQALRKELERVLSSATFVRNERVSKLLRFLVERELEGRESELKETSIGVEVFGRKTDYDPKLGSTVRTLGRGRRRYETSTEAYDLYLRARAAGTQRFPGDVAVIDLFKKAIAKDPSLAPAYAGLAGAYAFQSFVQPDGRDHAEKLSKMRTAAEKAIQFDPLLAEAHSALGTAYARNGQWDQAELSLRRAIQINPSLSIAHDNLTWFLLFPLGRIEEAIREARAELRLDPLSPMAHYLLAETLISAGRYDEAASQCEILPPDFVFTSDCLGRAWFGQGRTANAIRVLATADSWGYLAYAYGRAGLRDEVERLSAEAPLARPNRHGHFQYALVYAGLKDKDRTIEHLERWAGVGPVRIGFTLTGPEFVFVRDDPRLKALRKRVGLPDSNLALHTWRALDLKIFLTGWLSAGRSSEWPLG